jgi:hypothetical protein
MIRRFGFAADDKGCAVRIKERTRAPQSPTRCGNYNLDALIELVEHGRAAELAVQILAPLEGRNARESSR